MMGEIKWLNGPYPCGKYNDITIFRDSLVSFLDDFERVEADDAYERESPFRCKILKAVYGAILLRLMLFRRGCRVGKKQSTQGLRHMQSCKKSTAMMLHNMVV
jgi:hypothetical protein